MFSAVLFHDKKPISAAQCTTTVQLVGHIGQGEASLTYDIDTHHTDLLLCVPSLIAHRDATRQQVRVTHCQVQKQVENQSPSVSKLEACRLDPIRHGGPTVPQHSELKKSTRDTLVSFAGTHSSSDFFLYVGEMPAGSQLQLRVKFLLKFISVGSSPTNFTVQNRIPCRRLDYTMHLALPLKVEDVRPLFKTKPSELKWTGQGENVAKIQYRHAAVVAAEPVSDSSVFHSGFDVQLSNGVAVGCCNVLSFKGRDVVGCHDGVMMMSNSFSDAQLPRCVQEKKFHPSEFIFVIDCSGSMSGTNIQAAANTLITCVKSLPEESFFNVVAFGSTFRVLFHTSAKYGQSSVERAIQFANQLQASLGGTELLIPLRWIFKKPKCGGLPRQIFIVTDGGVTNTSAVLHIVRKNRHLARCHTFGLGPEVCVELVTGIAAASGGHCVLLSEGQRLQTKVMEVLQDSLKPALVDTSLSWDPPAGYTVISTTPEHLGTLHSGNTYTAFAILGKAVPQGVKDQEGAAPRHHQEQKGRGGGVTIAGSTGDEEVKIHVDVAEIPSLTSAQGAELLEILSRAASWSRLCELEEGVACRSGRLNGGAAPAPQVGCGDHAHHPGEDKASCVVEELVHLSLETGIPTALTVLVDRTPGSRVAQIVPMQQQQQTKVVPANGHHHHHHLSSQKHIVPSMYRKRKHDHFAQDVVSSPPPSFSISSLAKNALTAVSTKLKAVVGLVDGDDVSLALENGIRIDDLEYQQNGNLSLRWDGQRKELLYPEVYYSHGIKHGRSTGRCGAASAPKKIKACVAVHGGGALHPYSSSASPPGSAPSPPLLSIVVPRFKHRSATKGASAYASGHLMQTASAAAARPLAVCVPTNPLKSRFVSGGGPFAASVPTNQLKSRVVGGGGAGAMADGDNEDAVMGEDESSDSSVDPDWSELRPPSELLPLIHMQLFSGAWPMVRAFSYAVGVPLEELRKLPLKADCQGGIELGNEEANLNFWATAVAVECLKEYFAPLHSEWALVAHKGQCWLEQNLHKTDFSIDRVQSISRSLVSRHS